MWNMDPLMAGGPMGPMGGIGPGMMGMGLQPPPRKVTMDDIDMVGHPYPHLVDNLVAHAQPHTSPMEQVCTVCM